MTIRAHEPALVTATAAPELQLGRDDELLLARARDGDRTAFDRLHRRYASMVHAVLLAHARRSDVDDLMQEVFLSAWRSLDQLRAGEHLGAWLGTIARNRARRAARFDRPMSSLEHEPRDDRPLSDDARDVLAVLATLPDAYRETLTMRLVEGLTGPEIAACTGLTHGSVRVNLTRGMARLREALLERGWS